PLEAGVKLTICAGAVWPVGALNTSVAGLAITAPVALPEVTLRATVMVTVPAVELTVMCPMNGPTGSRAAVAVTVRVAGVPAVTGELPLVTDAVRKLGESVETP